MVPNVEQEVSSLWANEGLVPELRSGFALEIAMNRVRLANFIRLN